MDYKIILLVVIILVIFVYYYRINQNLTNNLDMCTNSSQICVAQLGSVQTENQSLSDSLGNSAIQIQSLQVQILQLTSSNKAQTEQGKQALAVLQNQLATLQSQLATCQVGSQSEVAQIQQLQASLTKYQADLASLQSTCIKSCPTPPGPTQFLFVYSPDAPDYGYYFTLQKDGQRIIKSVYPTLTTDSTGALINQSGNTVSVSGETVSNASTKNMLGEWRVSGQKGGDTATVMLSKTDGTFLINFAINGTTGVGYPSVGYPAIRDWTNNKVVTLVDGMFIRNNTTGQIYQLNGGMKCYMNTFEVPPYSGSNIPPWRNVSDLVLSLIPTGPNIN